MHTFNNWLTSYLRLPSHASPCLYVILCVWLFLQKLSHLRQIVGTNRILHLTIHLVQTWYQELLVDLP